MNCNKNGKTEVIALTTIPGGTAADASYLLALDHFTCGNRKLCTQDAYPVSADLKFTPIGQPVSVGNDSYCCEVLCSGICTYLPYVPGCCDVCPRTENIYCTFCVPCSSSTVPTLTAGVAVAAPANVQRCCNFTNMIAITTSVNVATATTTNADGE